MAIRPAPTPRPDFSDAGVARERRPVTRESVYDDVDRSGVLADLQDATEVQTLIDASVADFQTEAEAEAIAEGVVAAAIPDGTSVGDILEWDGAAWDAVAPTASGGGDPVMEWISA